MISDWLVSTNQRDRPPSITFWCEAFGCFLPGSPDPHQFHNSLVEGSVTPRGAHPPDSIFPWLGISGDSDLVRPLAHPQRAAQSPGGRNVERPAGATLAGHPAGASPRASSRRPSMAGESLSNRPCRGQEPLRSVTFSCSFSCPLDI